MNTKSFVKYSLIVLASLSIGAIGSYYFNAKKYIALNQISYELNISDNLRYLEVLETNGDEQLKELLVYLIECDIKNMNNMIENGSWQESTLSIKVREQYQKYRNDESNCEWC